MIDEMLIGDLRLGVSGTAWSILYRLSDTYLDEVGGLTSAGTYTWYNHEHRGFVILLDKGHPHGKPLSQKRWLAVAFGDHPVASSIMIDAWEHDSIRPPTTETREACAGAIGDPECTIRRYSRPTIDEAVKLILELIKEWAAS